MSSPNSAAWTSANLSGEVTVLAFFPDTTDNLRTVNQWNSRVEEFTAKPVQFVWITGEKGAKLTAWLAQHPIQGWVLFDPTGATGRAYGQELPAAVIVGRDGRIMGFTNEFAPSAEMLDAALEGRITTAQPSAEDLKSFESGGLVLLRAEPFRIPRADDSGPNFAPSYEVHIAPSQAVGAWDRSGDKSRSLEGFDLKRAFSTLYDIAPTRLELPSQVDLEKRYDFAIVLPDYEDPQQTDERMRQGILDHFGWTARFETRLVDVYVVTVSNPKLESLGSNMGGGVAVLDTDSLELGSRDSPPASPVNLTSVRNIAGDMNMDDFCRFLETSLNRPVLNETNLQGYFHIETTLDGSKDFVTRLREQAGIVITPSERNVEFLVIQ